MSKNFKLLKRSNEWNLPLKIWTWIYETNAPSEGCVVFSYTWHWWYFFHLLWDRKVRVRGNDGIYTTVWRTEGKEEIHSKKTVKSRCDFSCKNTQDRYNRNTKCYILAIITWHWDTSMLSCLFFLFFFLFLLFGFFWEFYGMRNT